MDGDILTLTLIGGCKLMDWDTRLMGLTVSSKYGTHPITPAFHIDQPSYTITLPYYIGTDHRAPLAIKAIGNTSYSAGHIRTISEHIRGRDTLDPAWSRKHHRIKYLEHPWAAQIFGPSHVPGRSLGRTTSSGTWPVLLTPTPGRNHDFDMLYSIKMHPKFET